jgi:NhaA family Na+:H+ antiporter
VSEPPQQRDSTAFGRGSWSETSRVTEILRKETVGGALLLLGSVVALIWINSPVGDSYISLRDFEVGPESLHLDLSLGTWAADGLLAIFFFVVGLELKREFVAGDLRDPRRAAMPIVAAAGGVAVPALIYTAVVWSGPEGALKGWAIPAATDIAFALAVLAIIATYLPAGLRTFLLTLAVVDDLIAVAIIAIFYTSDLSLVYFGLCLIPLAVFGLLVQRRVRAWWLLLPLALITWVLMHESGIHATVAGVLLGFTVPVMRSDDADGPGLAEHFEHLIRPISAGIAVPIFAFFSAGVEIGGLSGLQESFADPVALGIIGGLVLGKPIGIFGTSYLMARFTHASLDDELSWIDVFGVSVLAGIGFTVSLLVGELAFSEDPEIAAHVKVGILTASLTAALVAGVILKARDKTYERILAEESRDDDHDGIPDVFESDQRRS